jgi:hypothetical protein
MFDHLAQFWKLREQISGDEHRLAITYSFIDFVQRARNRQNIWLTAWRGVLETVKKLYGTPAFITVFIRARHVPYSAPDESNPQPTVLFLYNIWWYFSLSRFSSSERCLSFRFPYWDPVCISERITTVCACVHARAHARLLRSVWRIIWMY